MTSSTDFDRQLLAWLETAGPSGPADEALDAAFLEASTLPQRRAPWPIGPRPWPNAGHARVVAFGGLALATVALLVAGLALVVGARVELATPSVKPAVVAPASPFPTDARPTPLPEPVPFPAGLRGTWARLEPAAVGDNLPPDTLVLQLGAGGTIWSVQQNGWLMSGIEALEVTDTTIVVREVPVDLTPTFFGGSEGRWSCSPSHVGRYTWRLGELGPGTGVDASIPLELAVIDDPCGRRAELLAGTWRPSGFTPREGESSTIRVAGTDIHLAFPVAQYDADGNGSGWIFSSRDGRTAFGVWADPRIILDPCDERSATTDAATTADAFLAAIEQNPAFRIAGTERVLLGPDDVAATRVVLEPGANPQGCVQSREVADTFRVDRTWRLPTRADLYLAPGQGEHLLVFLVAMRSEGERDWVLRGIDVDATLP